jgi:hypothetical protein
VVNSYFFYHSASLDVQRHPTDPSLTEVNVIIRQPQSLDNLKALQPLGLKKTELKKMERDKKRLEKAKLKQLAVARVWEDSEGGGVDPWWYAKRKLCLNEIIQHYKYPMQKMLSED